MLLAAAVFLLAQDVFVPPVPRGIAREGKVRNVKKEIPFPRETPWIRVRTQHFDVLSNADDERTRAVAGDLESLAAALTAAVPRFQHSPTPATVFVFSDRRESQPYFDLLTAMEGTKVAGLYVRHGGGGAMFIDASRRAVERTATHELIHDLLRQGDLTPPLWLEEGLAEYIANAQVSKKGVIAGMPIPPHVSLLSSRTQLPIGTMLEMKAESPQSASSYFYAQSWAAVHWLMTTNPHAFFAFLQDLENGTTIAAALNKRYGRTLDDLQSSFVATARQTAPVKLTEHVPEITTASSPVDRATLLYELGSFLGHVAGAENESARHFAEALRIDPKHARTLAATGRYEAAVEADPNDPEVVLLYAESLLGHAIGDFAGVFEEPDVDAYRKARELATRALELHGDEARARGAIGVSYLVEADRGPGIAQLEQVRKLAPQRMDYAIHLYAMYLHSGARDKADALFAAAFENARDKQVAFAARNVLLDAETQRANALAQAGKLDEAAALVRNIAATIEDAQARADLEQQAAQIESVALVNRHIKMYNDAVNYSNAGRTRDAVKVLDELLAVASDPQVVRDAQRLRSELRGRK